MPKDITDPVHSMLQMSYEHGKKDAIASGVWHKAGALSLVLVVICSLFLVSVKHLRPTTPSVRSDVKVTELSRTEKIKAMRDSTVMVEGCTPEGPFGSGFTIITPQDDYVITAAHVVASFRTMTEGKTAFKKIRVSRLNYRSGVEVNRIYCDAEVVRYSDADIGHDLCLLRLARKGFAINSVSFFDGTVNVGTPVIACGTPGDRKLANTVTQGIFAATDRSLPYTDQRYDQIDAPVYYGNSGGPAFLKETGECIGVIVRMLPGQSNFGFIVPSWRIKLWADRDGISFIYNDTSNAPTKAQLDKDPIERDSEYAPSQKKIVDDGDQSSPPPNIMPPAPDEIPEECYPAPPIN